MKVAFILYDKALITGISLAAEMLTSAASMRSRSDQQRTPLTINLVTDLNNPPTLAAGLTLNADSDFTEVRQFDLIILPPMWGNPMSVLKRRPETLDWLIDQYKGGAKVLATGTGVCWLAETGLLSRQVATTHWYYYDKFSKRYPLIRLNRKASITEANGLYCATSINSQAEMVLHWINEKFGQKIAIVIETHFGHEISKSDDQPFYQLGGQLQFDESIAFAQDWMKHNMSRNITIAQVAQASELPLRTLNRKFQEQVGISPNQFLQKLRMQTAKALLRDFSLTLTDITAQCGYKDSQYFSRLFLKTFDMRPLEYRNMVKAKVYRA